MNRLAILAHPRFCEDLARLIVEIMLVPSFADAWVIECIEKGPGRWCRTMVFESREERDEEAKEWRHHPWVQRQSTDENGRWYLHAIWLGGNWVRIDIPRT